MAKYWLTACAAALMLMHGTAVAGTSEKEKIKTATSVLHDFFSIPESAIPPTLLQNAYGIAVLPGVIKAGFIIGGRHGTGVLSVRTKSGAWSNPVFISLTGGSIGWQIGVSSTDLILVFKSRRSVEKIANGAILLGADASVAAGPIGRSATAATNLALDAEIYSYSQSRGLFLGIALEGGKLSINHAATADFYNNPHISANQMLQSTDRSRLPPAGRQFITTLQRFLPQPES